MQTQKLPKRLHRPLPKPKAAPAPGNEFLLFQRSALNPGQSGIRPSTFKAANGAPIFMKTGKANELLLAEAWDNDGVLHCIEGQVSRVGGDPQSPPTLGYSVDFSRDGDPYLRITSSVAIRQMSAGLAMASYSDGKISKSVSLTVSAKHWRKGAMLEVSTQFTSSGSSGSHQYNVAVGRHQLEALLIGTSEAHIIGEIFRDQFGHIRFMGNFLEHFQQRLEVLVDGDLLRQGMLIDKNNLTRPLEVFLSMGGNQGDIPAPRDVIDNGNSILYQIGGTILIGVTGIVIVATLPESAPAGAVVLAKAGVGAATIGATGLFNYEVNQLAAANAAAQQAAAQQAQADAQEAQNYASQVETDLQNAQTAAENDDPNTAQAWATQAQQDASQALQYANSAEQQAQAAGASSTASSDAANALTSAEAAQNYANQAQQSADTSLQNALAQQASQNQAETQQEDQDQTDADADAEEAEQDEDEEEEDQEDEDDDDDGD